MNFNLIPFSKNGEFYSHLWIRINSNLNYFLEQKVEKNISFNPLLRILMKMNIIAMIIVLAMTQVNARSIAQQITLNRQNAKLSTVLKDLEKQSGFNFFYKKTDVEGVKDIDINFKATPLNSALNSLLAPRNLTFEYFDRTIVIKKKLDTPKKSSETPLIIAQLQSQQRGISGKVLDENGQPIAGASIRIKNESKKVVMSDKIGNFILPLTATNEVVVVSFLGYSSYEFKAVLTSDPYIIKLQPKENEVDEVVVTGMINFKKESFSGASSSYNQEQLKQVANTNVIQAVKALDPSFLVMENNLSGGNPNVLPNIELRGQTSITSDNLRDEFTDDPNQPLFILDGFQTNLRTILDLDMNRIASITILKDASSTAIYGSRASNGVVHVETIKPSAGEVRLNYTSDLNFEVADLNSYNMMNAAEKLEFERLTGIYTAASHQPELQHTYYDILYNEKLERVLSGVDSYWLRTPIQGGFAHRHSLYAEGGNENLVFNIGGNFKNNDAVMIGSGRQEWGSRLNLIYRRNKFSVANNLTIQGNKATESKFGSFATWANLNPYYGNIDISNPILDTYIDRVYGKSYLVYNPLYNVNLNSFDKEQGFGVTNNFQMFYDFSNKLKLQSSFQILKNSRNSNVFVSPLDTRFQDVSILESGSLNSRKYESFSYTANAMLTYATTIDKHALTGNFRIEFSENNNNSLGFVALGFPTTSNGNPAFAYGYDKNGSPTSNRNISRRNSFIGSFNYSYGNRYNADLSFNYDGSTAFGKQNVYSPFFATGLSWNLHNEKFLKDNPLVNQLRLRANYGVTGNQNFSSTTSISTYRYLNAYNYSGQGVALATFANENLKWQKTNQLSAGIDATLFQNRLNVVFNAYQKITNNLAVAVDLPASTGLLAYPFNAGDLTVKGLELTAKYNIIYRPEDRIIWNIGLTGAKSSQTYSNFNDLLAGLNRQLTNSVSLRRYKDGYSSSDLWAVRSLGIDPSTGMEIFLTEDGTKTFDYSEQDIVVVGNSNPRIQGILSTNLTYKGFGLNAMMRYIWDQDIMNTALFNKVENISLTDVLSNNQDKRALYDRWKKPGDISQFRGISITQSTKPSSRFIQQENSLSLESLSLSYDFRDHDWIKMAGLSRLRISAITNDIFRVSTVRRERGIDYPYAKMYSFSLNANF